MSKFSLSHISFQKLSVVDASKEYLWSTELTLSQTSLGFYVSAVQVFRKQCGKSRNCSYRAISPFPSVFYRFGELSAIFIKFEIVVCKLFEIGRVQNLSFGKALSVSSFSEVIELHIDVSCH